MRHLRAVGCGLIVGLLSGLGFATDAPTTSAAVPHIFVPGQIVSADQLNENFAAVKPDLAETLIGTWATQCWDLTVTDGDAPLTGTTSIRSLTDFTYTGYSCLAESWSRKIGQVDK